MSTYAEAVAMYEVSRLGKPKNHLIDDLAAKVIEAGIVGATVLDNVTDRCLAHQSPAIMPNMCLRTWVEIPVPASPCVIDRGPGRGEESG